MKNSTTTPATANNQAEITFFAKTTAQMAEMMVNTPAEYLEEGERNLTPEEMKGKIYGICESRCPSAPEMLFRIVLKHFYADYPVVYRECFNDPSKQYFFP